MIQTNWRKYISRSGATQNQVADALGMNRGEFSRVCQGITIMKHDMLTEAAAHLGCKVTDLYSSRVLAAIYPDMYADTDATPAPVKPRIETVSVRVRKDVAERCDALVEAGEYRSRNELVNSILERAI